MTKLSRQEQEQVAAQRVQYLRDHPEELRRIVTSPAIFAALTGDDIHPGARVEGPYAVVVEFLRSEREAYQQEKVRENRLRRAAERQGLLLQKSRRRDPRALGYGTYQLVDARTNAVVDMGGLPGGYGLDLDQVARELGLTEQSGA